MINRKDLNELYELNARNFEGELRKLQKGKDRPFGFSKKQIDDMIVGFADGQRSMQTGLVAMGVLKVTE